MTELIEALRESIDNVTIQDLADILWLASRIDSSLTEQVASLATTEAHGIVASQSLPHTDNQALPTKVVSPLPQPIAQNDVSFETPKGRTSLLLGLSKGPTQKPEEDTYKLIFSPTSSLQDALDISRAFRPLMRRVPSRTALAFDEERTAQGIAERLRVQQNIWFPEFHHVPTRWLELALVIDESRSMDAWRPTIAEFKQLLEYHGAFRDVRTWRFSTGSTDGHIKIYPGTESRQNRAQERAPGDLIDPGGRRLILVVSDCVSPMWHNGSMSDCLTQWGKHGPVAILQVFSQSFWPKTALGDATRVYLHAKTVAISNTLLSCKSWPDGIEMQDRQGIKIPVVSLSKEPLLQWIQATITAENAWTPGYVFSAQAPQTTIQTSEEPLEQPTMEELLDYFNADASPEARELLLLLVAAAPINLRLARHIQGEILPESGPGHVAEILLSGLVELQPGDESDPDLILYNFIEGVRDAVLPALPASKWKETQILADENAPVEQRIGLRLLLENPYSMPTIPIKEENYQFAKTAAMLFRGLGGPYRAVSEHLKEKIKDFEQSSSPVVPLPATPETENFEPIIAGILTARQAIARRIKSIQQTLQKRVDDIRELMQLENQLMNDPSLSQEPQKPLEKLLALAEKIERLIQDLEKPRLRLSRETLNIAVVGRARQGKSRLLQGLSGLDSALIPTGYTGFCTGVRCVISYHAERKAQGEIIFYSEEEFISGVIEPYYEKLALGPAPESLEQFDTETLPPLPASIPEQPGHTKPAEMYRHLFEYKTHLAEYKDFIGSQSTVVPREGVRAYIAQDVAIGETLSFKYLAVKEVHVSARFGRQDLRQIALIDMPGLGDTGIGAEERLVQTLGEYVDIVLLVKMPGTSDATLADVDSHLYDLLYRAFSYEGLPVEDWLFLLLNHTETIGKNHDNCLRIQTAVNSGATGSGQRRFRVVDSLVVDCSDPRQIQNDLLERVLSYLADNQKIDDLYNKYLLRWRKDLSLLQRELDVALRENQRTLGKLRPPIEKPQTFHKLFGYLWGELTTALDNALKEIREMIYLPNTIFDAYFTETLNRCLTDTGLPSREDLKSMRNEFGSYERAFYYYLDVIWTRMINHFIDIDDRFKLNMDELKRLVIHVLLEEGRLKYFAKDIPEQDFLSWMAQHPALSPHLQTAFKALDEYELSFRGFFLSRIRACIRELDPARASFKLPSLTTLEDIPEGIIELLTRLHRDAVNELEIMFKGFKNEPAQAALAIIEEFVDEILHARNAKNDWNVFYETGKKHIWANEYDDPLRAARAHWKLLIDNTIAVNKDEDLRLSI